MEARGYPGLAGASGSEKKVLGSENGLWRHLADRQPASQARVERQAASLAKKGGPRGACGQSRVPTGDWRKDEGRKLSSR